MCVINGSYFWHIPKTSWHGPLSQNPTNRARNSEEWLLFHQFRGDWLMETVREVLQGGDAPGREAPW